MRDHNDPTSPLDDLAHGQSADAPRTVDAVLGQAVAVLRAFGTDDTHVTVDELVGRSGLTFGVVREIVQALVTTRLLEPTGTGYRLSTLLFELGCARRPSAV
jgi:DNA-binding IclR family transcriptional regulator